MKALRIVLTQSSANYKKEETLDNKMTYPLPPVSTIIGAIHNACNYKEYHPMDISIQGKFESMHKEPYTDYCFHNSFMNDRDIMVKLKNENLLSKGFEKIAKKQGSSSVKSNFIEGENIEIYNKELLNEYQRLKKGIGNRKLDIALIDAEIKLIKARIKELTQDKKKLEKNNPNMIELLKELDKLKQKRKSLVFDKEQINSDIEINYNKPLSQFKTLVTSLKFYEILNNIELVIHVRADEDTLKNIEENIYSLKAIGRSEDFVDIKEAKVVTLLEDYEEEVKSNYSAYLNYDDVINRRIWFDNIESGIDVSGTKYYLNKNYEIVDGKRIFEKKKVLYASNYFIEETSENILVDKEDEKEYIVNFI